MENRGVPDASSPTKSRSQSRGAQPRDRAHVKGRVGARWEVQGPGQGPGFEIQLMRGTPSYHGSQDAAQENAVDRQETINISASRYVKVNCGRS